MSLFVSNCGFYSGVVALRGFKWSGSCLLIYKASSRRRIHRVSSKSALGGHKLGLEGILAR